MKHLVKCFVSHNTTSTQKDIEHCVQKVCRQTSTIHCKVQASFVPQNKNVLSGNPKMSQYFFFRVESPIFYAVNHNRFSTFFPHFVEFVFTLRCKVNFDLPPNTGFQQSFHRFSTLCRTLHCIASIVGYTLHCKLIRFSTFFSHFV